MDLTGIGICIMTGGKSTRMGTDKALLTVSDNETMLQRLCRRLNDFEYKYISVNENQPYQVEGYSTIIDEYKQIGPIGGIVSVLKKTQAKMVIFVACDMPLYTIKEAEETVLHWSGEDVVIPVCDSRWQPLAALYSKSLIPLLEASILRGEYKLRTVIEKSNNTEFFPTNSDAYINVNTKEELERYLARENNTANRN